MAIGALKSIYGHPITDTHALRYPLYSTLFTPYKTCLLPPAPAVAQLSGRAGGRPTDCGPPAAAMSRRHNSPLPGLRSACTALPDLLPDWPPGDGGLQLSAPQTCLSEEPLTLQRSRAYAGVDGWSRSETTDLRLSGHDAQRVGDGCNRPWRD